MNNHMIYPPFSNDHVSKTIRTEALWQVIFISNILNFSLF